MEAVKQNGSALRFASEELRRNREVVMEALEFASEELRREREIVIQAIRIIHSSSRSTVTCPMSFVVRFVV
eukprot:13940181-Heterocapsa_arctica.AAC.1